MHTLYLLISLIFTYNISANEISDIQHSYEIDYIQQLQESDLISSNSPYYGGYNKLIDYVIPAPYQENAGSCLYMSHTGVIEWWLNKRAKNKTRIDLSERYYMSLKTNRVNQENIDNWRTDNIQRLNKYSKMMLNDHYPFTKSYFKKIKGKRVSTTKADPEAKYGTRYNWIDRTTKKEKSKLFSIPKFERKVLFADPKKNQWNVAVAPLDISKRIKNALIQNESPVLVIYNHKGFWHANYIYGFNDNINHNCPYVRSFPIRMKEKAQEFEELAYKTDSSKRKNSLLKKAKKYRNKAQKVEERFNKIGCSKKGAFYVRDSIYPNEKMPLYTYATQNNEDDQHLNSALILREYEWATTTLNHAIQIYPIKDN